MGIHLWIFSNFSHCDLLFGFELCRCLALRYLQPPKEIWSELNSKPSFPRVTEAPKDSANGSAETDPEPSSIGGQPRISNQKRQTSASQRIRTTDFFGVADQNCTANRREVV